MTRFWLSALAAVAGTAGLAGAALPLLLRLEPRGWAGPLLMTASEIWLLEVFTAGVLALLLGLASLGGGWFDARGVRDVLERRDTAPEPRAGAGPERRGDEEGGTTDREERKRGDIRPAWWLIAVGGGLLGIYATGWLLLG